MVNKNESNLGNGIEIPQSPARGTPAGSPLLRSDPSAAAILNPHSNVPVSVLIVDDNPAKLIAMAAALTGMDIVIVTATSGMEALRKLLEQEFAVVLLDVNMPIMDGFETAAMIRRRPRTEHMPIIFVTAERLSEDARMQGYELGAVDYLLSPVLPYILRSKVAVFADLYRLREQSYRDNQELLEKSEQIARQSLMLEASSRLKSEFFASLSHELRTPLNSILGFSQVLKDGVMGELTPQQQKQATLIYSSGQHLLALINDSLDLSKVEAGKLALEPSEIKLPALLNNGLLMLREQAAKHRIQLALDIEPGLETITADERKLRQVLYNLLANAVKFTADCGRVSVTARRTQRAIGKDARCEAVEIAVADNGIGIAAEDMDKLFMPFSQIDAALGRRQNGTGLGLMMVKRLVELHGGGVEVTSEVGKGSCFSFWVPMHPAPGSSPGQALEEQLAIPLSPKVRGKRLVISPQAGKSLVMETAPLVEATSSPMPPPQPSPALRAREGASKLLPPLAGEGWDGGTGSPRSKAGDRGKSSPGKAKGSGKKRG